MDANPWNVDNLDVFLYYWCPECSEKWDSKPKFIHHALSSHPKAKDYIPTLSIKDDFDNDIIEDSKTKVKNEFSNGEVVAGHGNHDGQNEVEEEEDYKTQNDFEQMVIEQNMEENDQNDPDYFYDDEDMKYEDTEDDLLLSQKIVRRRIKDNPENSVTEVQCYYCSEIFMKSNIEDHMRTLHGRFCSSMFGEKRAYSCPKCKKASNHDPANDSHICQPFFVESLKMKDAYRGPYKCDQCYKVFPKRRSLFIHMNNTHTKERNFICDQCDYKAKTSMLLKKHIKTVHLSEVKRTKCEEGDEMEVQCYYCSKMFMNTDVEMHMRKDHGRFLFSMFGPVRPYKCNKCERSLDKDPSQDTHTCLPTYVPSRKGNHVTEADLKCEKCNKKFTKRGGLFRHMNTVHSEERNFACSQCDYKAKTSGLLRRHIKCIHDKELKFVCDICGKKFFENYFLQQHRKVHKAEAALPGMTEADLKSYTCDKCGKAFTTQFNLSYHYSQEHPKPEVLAAIEANCHICEKVFENAYVLNNHLPTCTKDLKEFHCDKCGSMWYSANALRKHIAETHNLVTTICDICGVTLKSKYYLDTHKKAKHEKTKNFTCDFCGKAFSIKMALKNHISRVHDQSMKKYSCDNCDFTCDVPSRMKHHKNAAHNKSVKYDCHLCKFSTYRKDGLQTHIKVVHEKYRPHQCDMCDMSFAYKRDKLKHLANIHGIAEQEMDQ